MTNDNFKFENMLKGNIAQTLFKTLLEDAGYSVVPFGVEGVYREIRDLTTYVPLPPALQKMPDFVVTNKAKNEIYLVEVKYRKEWDIPILGKLGERLQEQFCHWNPLYLVFFVGEIEERHKPVLMPIISKIIEYDNVTHVELKDGEEYPIEMSSPCSWKSLNEVFTDISAERLKENLEKISKLLELLKGIKS
jgi:hypothetical protein